MYKEIKKIAVSALLVALGVIFSRFLSIPLSLLGVYSINIGFGLLPILLLCVLYGPIYGLVGAFCWDLLGALLFPNGAFVIWFTLAAGVLGIIVGGVFSKIKFSHTCDNEYGYGSVLTVYHCAKKITLVRIIIAVAFGQIVYSVLLNSILISALYSVPFNVLIIPRLIENAIMIPVNAVLLNMLIKVVIKANLAPERFSEKDLPNFNANEHADKINYSDLLGQVGGYICNKNYAKALELYETIMIAFRKDSSILTRNQRLELAQYKVQLETHCGTCVVVEPAFDVDHELAQLAEYINKNDKYNAATQLSMIDGYYNANKTMLNSIQLEQLNKAKQWCDENIELH